MAQVIVAYTEAVKTVIPHKATGKPHLLWVDFARFYEDSGGGDLNDAATIFAKAVEQPFKFVDDLAQVHAAWAEMYIRHKKYKAALTVVQRACSAPSAAMIREQRVCVPSCLFAVSAGLLRVQSLCQLWSPLTFCTWSCLAGFWASADCPAKSAQKQAPLEFVC